MRTDRCAKSVRCHKFTSDLLLQKQKYQKMVQNKKLYRYRSSSYDYSWKMRRAQIASLTRVSCRQRRYYVRDVGDPGS